MLRKNLQEDRLKMTSVKKFTPHLLFLVVLVVLIFTTYRDFGIAWDEKTYPAVGKHYFIQILDTLQISHNLTDELPLNPDFDWLAHMRVHGVLFDVMTISVTLFLNDASFEMLHLVRALLVIPTFILLALIVRRLLDARLALVSMVFLLLFPRFYGDMFNNAVDVPTALAFALSVFYFLYYLTSKQTLVQQLLLGVIMGLTIQQRFALVYVLILNLAVLSAVELYKKQKRWKAFYVKIATVVFSTIATLHITHPYLLQKPLVGLLDTLFYSGKFTFFDSQILFEGRFVHAGHLPWYYLPKSMLITIPLVTVALFFIGTAYLFYLVLKEKKTLQKIMHAYLFALFYLPLLLVFILKPVLYDSWRHFLFLTIPIIIISMYGLHTLTKISRKLLKYASLFLVVVGLLFTAREMVLLHPYQYIYYNSTVGGLQGADAKYETDYWGAAYKEAVEWFNTHINEEDKQYVIKSEGDPLSLTYYFKDNMSYTYEIAQADYYISFTRWNKHLVQPAKPVHIIKRRGAPLVYISRVDKSQLDTFPQYQFIEKRPEE